MITQKSGKLELGYMSIPTGKTIRNVQVTLSKRSQLVTCSGSDILIAWNQSIDIYAVQSLSQINMELYICLVSPTY